MRERERDLERVRERVRERERDRERERLRDRDRDRERERVRERERERLAGEREGCFEAEEEFMAFFISSISVMEVVFNGRAFGNNFLLVPIDEALPAGSATLETAATDKTGCHCESTVLLNLPVPFVGFLLLLAGSMVVLVFSLLSDCVRCLGLSMSMATHSKSSTDADGSTAFSSSGPPLEARPSAALR